MMKILLVNKLYYPHIGGIETVVRNIAEGLNNRADINVLVCSGEKSDTKDEIINGVKVKRCKSMGTYFSMPVSLSFFRYFREMSEKSDIVHIHMPFPLADIACFLSGYKGKVILSWHSDIVKQKKLMVFYKPFMKYLLERADKIVVATQGHIDGSSYLKPYAGKCCIIPYGIDAEKYGIYDRKLLECTDKSSKKALFIGRLVYYKGVDILISAFERIRGCELFIIGTGKLEDELKTKTLRMGMSDKIHFMGSLSDDDVKSALNECDMFILPSVAKSEAFGIVQMEAMIYGKPVINTNLSTGVPYVSIDGETGITVPVNDAGSLADAVQKLTDDELRKSYGQNAYRRVRECFSMDKMLDSLYDLYKNEVKMI
jgi:rhamnosyl/mannosyltransferase